MALSVVEFGNEKRGGGDLPQVVVQRHRRAMVVQCCWRMCGSVPTDWGAHYSEQRRLAEQRISADRLVAAALGPAGDESSRWCAFLLTAPDPSLASRLPGQRTGHDAGNPGGDFRSLTDVSPGTGHSIDSMESV